MKAMKNERKDPPVMVIRVPISCGSFGYGAKVDGNKICIPFNPAVISYVGKNPMQVATMARTAFNKLPVYEEGKE